MLRLPVQLLVQACSLLEVQALACIVVAPLYCGGLYFGFCGL